MGMGEPSVSLVGVSTASPDVGTELEEASSEAENTIIFS
jgi:hypothetical protein